MSTAQTSPERILALQYADHSMEIVESRMPSATELEGWADWYKPRALYGVAGGQRIKLQHFAWQDIETVFGARKATHSFPGCGNRAWILTDAERIAILEIERSRSEAKAAADTASEQAASAKTQAIVNRAKATNADQQLEGWMANCDGTVGNECSFDACARMVRPDGSTYVTRTHCF
jgi:hypothetical protein